MSGIRDAFDLIEGKRRDGLQRKIAHIPTIIVGQDRCSRTVAFINCIRNIFPSAISVYAFPSSMAFGSSGDCVLAVVVSDCLVQFLMMMDLRRSVLLLACGFVSLSL